MKWTIKRTDTFLSAFSHIRANPAFIRELGKKIQRLKEDPQHVGGWLHGKLHGKKSTRIANKYRLIFSIEEESHTVFLLMIDHREEIYHRK